MEWISVEDKLPSGYFSSSDICKDLSEEVLFCDKLTVYIGVYDRGYECFKAGEPFDDDLISSVSYWMPLPKLPNK